MTANTTLPWTHGQVTPHAYHPRTLTKEEAQLDGRLGTYLPPCNICGASLNNLFHTNGWPQ